MPTSTPQVLIVMGSANDLPVMQPALEAMELAGLQGEIRVCSAHRSPALAMELASTARDRGFSVIIAGAGLAAHLPGVLAGCTTLPVIGVPISAGPLHGVDALQAIVQMPRGVPVATVAIDNSWNAGLLAVRMLGVSDPDIADWLERYRLQLEAGVQQDDAKVRQRVPGSRGAPALVT